MSYSLPYSENTTSKRTKSFHSNGIESIKGSNNNKTYSTRVISEKDCAHRMKNPSIYICFLRADESFYSLPRTLFERLMYNVTQSVHSLQYSHVEICYLTMSKNMIDEKIYTRNQFIQIYKGCKLTITDRSFSNDNYEMLELLLTTEQYENFLNYVQQHIGRPFNEKAYQWNFIIDNDYVNTFIELLSCIDCFSIFEMEKMYIKTNRKSFFCSEFICDCLIQIGFFKDENMKPWLSTPDTILNELKKEKYNRMVLQGNKSPISSLYGDPNFIV